ncbi:hypothetical protein BATDEDRAFT_10274 [Batrachochytrium dendrobatidis JAM81]|uniref:DSBA-like thioredoxin domain-containing protein n=2 Tax=Batrachochytrium dendrobatidis TaxID=109871 RepID=F4NYL4_BATDJ|nr:uncharacterized protein BATDEDRAFT_10274 [Batrachochytrium dendrobatidis JAM81]EGF82047.1 hypothetical protein BATDEDRAFT_10274 [Batrachochytrium dendrobatidis JAM81]KAK5671132.1 hypothetical protein QVD99_002892 [Batrachochytrium dendrobatidis]OAJ40185.1 hypothetical protein BDEG_23949 [Batrachochytrium dendrobatidis JEL423]|eukprot:XP_006677161.1 hypothetical protein BATDEDRAFT_10274 [Batrachochytrium dendrobatidis JAM81]
MTTTIKIDITSDVVCPWCFVGQRRLETAITTFKAQSHDNVIFDIKYLPFELGGKNGLTKQGIPKVEYLANKFGASAVASMNARMADLGKEENIAFRFGGNRSNTLDAHRILYLAAQKGIQYKVSEGLFSAYHEHERNIGDDQVLADVYAAAGGDRNEAIAYLKTDQNADVVKGLQQKALQKGVNGVPYFEIEEYKISGAESSQTFVSIFEKILEARQV